MIRIDHGLLVSKAQVELARAGGSSGFLVMHPQLFLDLTVPSPVVYNLIAFDTKAVETYNKYTLSKMSNMPELVIDLDTHQVYRHDGRHRARSLINAGVEKMPVAIYCRRNNVQVYGWEAKDLPTTWYNQFNKEIGRPVNTKDLNNALCFLALIG